MCQGRKRLIIWWFWVIPFFGAHASQWQAGSGEGAGNDTRAWEEGQDGWEIFAGASARVPRARPD